MFHSFFPKPKLFFLSFAVYALALVIGWYTFGDRLQFLSIGPVFGVESVAPLEPGIAPDVEVPSEETTAPAEVEEGWADPQTFWFYQYMLSAIALFVGFWMWYAPHPWQLWSVAGSALIFFTNWFLVQLDVMINEWFGGFYDLIQQALAEPGSIDGRDYYLGIATFLQIALVYVFVAVIFRFFVSHYVFRWRTAMNDYYTGMWKRVRKIEGASQRVQEDTMRFASITEGLGVALLDSVMTLIAFLPLLWGLSAAVTELPLIGEVSQGLVFVAIVWSILGTVLLAVVGIRLPGLEFNNQKVEAAYRKELVMGEDFTERAQPQSLTELFSDVRRNYFRLYFNYMYFNVVRIFYLQIGNLVPFIALGPTIIAGTITLGTMQQIMRAFGRVEGSFQYLVNSWTTIVELMSVYKRLNAFEKAALATPESGTDTKVPSPAE
ncbi:peptide antibiotic transporter SbmA [Ahrensia marina]|uniref:peptide antibiotic transporter SbmA n=1 Tax=Ahrensia marina TaxID=1514904 RepID=UPI0035CEDC37